MDIAKGSILGPLDGHVSLLDMLGRQAGSGSGPSISSVRFRNHSAGGITLADAPAQGYWQNLYMADIHVEESYVNDRRVSDPGDISKNIRANWCNIHMGVPATSTFPLPSEQVIEFVDCYCDTLMQYLINAHGASGSGSIPTTVTIRGGSMVNRANRLVVSDGVPAFLVTSSGSSCRTSCSILSIQGGWARRDDVVDPWLPSRLCGIVGRAMAGDQRSTRSPRYRWWLALPDPAKFRIGRLTRRVISNLTWVYSGNR